MTPRPQFRPLSMLLLAGAALAGLAPHVPLHRNVAAAPAPPAAAPVNLPLAFEPNVGQADSGIDFLARGRDFGAYFTPEGMVLAVRAPGASERRVEAPRSHRTSAVRMRLVDANRNAAPRASAELPGRVNYLIGNDPSQWRTGVATFDRVGYTAVYPRVDLEYYGRDGALEYDFIVAPGGDPERVKLRFDGADRTRIDRTGDLVLDTPAGEIRHLAPFAYQEVDGVRRRVACNYRLEGNTVGFQLGAFDPGARLVIDPVVRTPNTHKLVYSTFVGGLAHDAGNAIALDGDLNVYVAGETFSTAFPAGAKEGKPESDVFVVKLDPRARTVLYTTFIGGSGNDSGVGLSLARGGHLCLAGNTTSPDFPIVRRGQGPAGGADGFHLQLHRNGRLLMRSTCLGGSGDDYVRDMAADTSGRLYVAGVTDSPDFPLRRPLQEYGGGTDGFLTVAAAGSGGMALSTYLGGSADDSLMGVGLGRGGVVFLCGQTASADFPVKSPMQSTLKGASDAFVTKLKANGRRIVYSTFLGDSGEEAALDIVEDFRRGAVITGWTGSQKFPTRLPLQSVLSGPRDAFLMRIDRAGRALIHSTFLGGSGLDQGNRVVLDPYDNIYLTGQSTSPDFPVRYGAQMLFGGAEDAFAMQLTAPGTQVLHCTYLGGEGADQGRGIAVDRYGYFYVTGATASHGFPNTLPNTGRHGGTDAFVTKVPSGADFYVRPRP